MEILCEDQRVFLRAAPAKREQNSLNSYHNENIFGTSIVENNKTHILCTRRVLHVLFFEAIK